MRLRTTICLFALGSVGCHRCSDPDPIESTDTENGTFADDCGFVCGDVTSGSSFTTTTAPPLTTSPGEASGGDTGPQDECLASSECGAALFCVAPFDQTLGPEGKGAYACVAECVPFMDENLWCADAAACCDASHVCTDRGYCVPPELDTGSDTGQATGDSDSGSGSSSDDGSGSGSGSSSGGTGSTG